MGQLQYNGKALVVALEATSDSKTYRLSGAAAAGLQQELRELDIVVSDIAEDGSFTVSKFALADDALASMPFTQYLERKLSRAVGDVGFASRVEEARSNAGRGR
ncbi:MAG: hypothetical protein C0519_09670 [Hyphomicrobium sp.]|nr:hypothetical protein [Hyphomicrobium sp.]